MSTDSHFIILSPQTQPTIMPVTALDSLPIEILVRICELLDHDHVSSVLAFALTSKYHFSAASTLLLRTIKFHVLSRPQLARAVQEYRDILQRSAGFRHVRRLIVDGLAPQKNYKNFNNPRFQRRQLMISAQERGYPDTVFGRLDYDEDEEGYDPVKVDHTSVDKIDESWKPLADLIPELSALSDLIYGCPSQFPPCILRALHEHRPQCRLHINRFYLRSINSPTIDAYEIMLASSPCLYSIRVLCKFYHLSYLLRHLECPHDFNIEASLNLVSGLAPSLKRIHWQFERSRLGRSCHKIRTDLPSGTEPKNVSCGLLQCLGYSGLGSMSKVPIKAWMKHIDFSALQTLTLEYIVDWDALQLLSNECRFPSLKALLLRQEPVDRGFPPKAYQFLRSLPPLSKLILIENSFTDSAHEESRVDLDSLIDHHGATLRELQLPTSLFNPLSQKNIELLRNSCLSLEDLKMTLKRTRGDSAEVRTYRTLGSLPRLRNLFITLNASDADVQRGDTGDVVSSSDSLFDEFERDFYESLFFQSVLRRPRNGHVRDAFINSALDENLAREIFRTISSGKQIGSLPLEKLKLEVIGGGRFATPVVVLAIAEVVRNLSRSWLIQRHPRDDRAHELIATDIYQKWRAEMRWRPLDKSVEPIFRRIWPGKEEGGDWWDDWHSMPLSLGT